MAIEERIKADARLAVLTPEKLEELFGSSGLKPKRGWAWLARAAQGALMAAESPTDASADRRDNSDVRKELFAVAEHLGKAAALLDARSREFDNAVLDAAWHGFQAQSDDDDPPDNRTFGEAVHHVDWLTVFLRRAGMMLDTQKPQWRNSARFAERVWRAQCLSVVYALAFEKEPTVNNWETAKQWGPWANFFQALSSAVFGEHQTPNLLEVLKAARRLDKSYRVQFGPGILPD